MLNLKKNHLGMVKLLFQIMELWEVLSNLCQTLAVEATFNLLSPTDTVEAETSHRRLDRTDHGSTS